MSDVRVRRAGLVSFIVKLGSLLTGLIFVVIVTTHLSPEEFGLWSLIGKTLGYTLLPASILWFWTTRYRARGTSIGKTILVASAIFSAVLSAVFIALSLPIAATIHSNVGGSPNLFFFLLSSPQVALYTFSGSFEALLWAISPEKNSVGFASFEFAKVALGFYLIDVLRLSLTGTILAVVIAQVFQFCFTMYLTRHEFKDNVSFSSISRMVKTGWLAILNNLHTLIRSFDFVLIAAFTGSASLLAYFAAALVISTVTGYSSYLGQGLYPNVLSGGDPKVAIKRVLELQLLFLCPMLLGGIMLRTQLLVLLNSVYGVASGILIILVISSSLDSLQSQFEATISATDTIDISEKVELVAYRKSRLFFLARINLSLAGVYLALLAVVGAIYGPKIMSNPASTGLLLDVGVIWASIYAIISATALVMKCVYLRRIAPFTLDLEMIRALVVGSAVFGVVMFLFAGYYPFPRTGEILEALNIIGVGLLGLAIYGAIVFALSNAVRELVKSTIQNLSGVVGIK